VRRRKLLNFSILIILDILILVSIFYISTYIRDSLNIDSVPRYIEISISDFIFAILTTIILFINEKIYSFRFEFWQETKKVLKALFLSYLLVLTILALTKSNFYYSRLFITIYFISSALIIPIFKLFIKRYLYSIDILKERVLLISKDRYSLEKFKREFKLN